MSNLSREDLSALYPKPKSFDEREAERASIEMQRRPRHVPAKISLWTTLCVPVVWTVYYLIVRVMSGGIHSEAAALSSVSFSALLTLGGMAAIFYLYSQIDGIAAKVVAAPSVLYGALLGVLLMTALVLAGLAKYWHGGAPAVAAAMLLCFTLTFITVRSILKHQ